jgi:hypothetical protein
MDMLYTILLFLGFVLFAAEGLHVLVAAFRRDAGQGILCLIIPFYAAYFVFRNSRALFKDRVLTRMWAWINMIVTIWIILYNLGVFDEM